MNDPAPQDPAPRESVPEFRTRARRWLAENMPVVDPDSPPTYQRDTDEAWSRARELQRLVHRGGFTGICFPQAYGGLGLPFEYQRAFDDETAGYEFPYLFNVPTLTICAPTILDMGSEQQRNDHVRAALAGDEVMAQLLSEPGGGSDLAGVTTRARWAGDHWVLTGSKSWSTAAFAADYGLCLARTDWDVPKHDGLTMFLVKIHQPRVTLRRVTQVNGSTEFCEEYFDEVELAPDAVVGEVGKGWEVASRQLFHERRTMGGGSEYSSGIERWAESTASLDLVALARSVGVVGDRGSQIIIGKALAQWAVRDQLVPHVTAKVESGELPPTAGSLIRLFLAETENVSVDAAFALGGVSAVVGGPTDTAEEIGAGNNYLARQSICLGGGSTEIARNVISERILNMPREFAADRGVPFSQVQRGRANLK